jgi:uncharacterized protein YjbI with pentapeptide repeats
VTVWFTLGPASRGLAGGLPRPGSAARRDLDAGKQLELANGARQTIMQAATAAGLVIGLAATAAGLYYTAQTLTTTRRAQITDRYTASIANLGSDKIEVREGTIYALARLAKDTDNPDDRIAIRNILEAYARDHLRQGATKRLTNDTRLTPAADVLAALATTRQLRDLVPADEGSLGLQYLDADGISLAGQNLRGVDLSHAQMTRTLLDGADLTEATVTNADFTETDGWTSRDTGCRLPLQMARLRATPNEGRTDFGQAHLRCADLAGATLSQAFFDHANLTFADLGGADLTDADLTRADARCATLSGAHIGGADLESTDLRGAHLAGADLRGATLLNTNLSGADLTRADLRGVNLDTARLDGAVVTGALLSGQTIKQKAQALGPFRGEQPGVDKVVLRRCHTG